MTNSSLTLKLIFITYYIERLLADKLIFQEFKNQTNNLFLIIVYFSSEKILFRKIDMFRFNTKLKEKDDQQIRSRSVPTNHR